MHRIIFGLLMIVSCVVFSQDNRQQSQEAPNAVTNAQQCMEFGYMADMYMKKAADGGIYAEKYILIAQNFKKMHMQCLETTNANAAYSGYRSNATQQQIQSPVRAK